MIEKLALVGDIHGDAPRLSGLLEKIGDRRLVFLGDYIDHGPDSKAMLQLLIQIASDRPNAIFLAGNHELGLLGYLSGKVSFLEYAWMGGLTTVQNYLGQAQNDVHGELLSAIPPTHSNFLSSCQPYFETECLIASHAGINPSKPHSREASDIVFGRHLELFEPGFHSEKLVVCGHYLQQSKMPLIQTRVACLDTGCGTIGGPLTALLFPEMTIVQM